MLTFVLLARIPTAGIIAFNNYEDQVLPLLKQHGGKLERRLRNADGSVEVHIVAFPSDAAFQDYRNDPRRQLSVPLLEASEAALEFIEVADVI